MKIIQLSPQFQTLTVQNFQEMTLKMTGGNQLPYYATTNTINKLFLLLNLVSNQGEQCIGSKGGTILWDQAHKYIA